MTGNDIRQRFLDYFATKGHQVVSSSSLVPYNDPTLLFTNAGMNQFKETFLGREKRDYVRAASAQKCVRAGGKHNDLENVGRTARHHTFFEMLGNFSFGDYFKQKAIEYGWEFLTQEMGLPPAKLWISVYEEDAEAYELWRDVIGVPEERIIRMGAKDNYWSMGDTGPCGPCSEIHIDQGEHMRCGPQCEIGVCECDRFLELWNLVFMQFDRAEDGTLTPLPKPSIDTGMGLERIAAVVQGVYSNFDCDLLRGLISYIEELSGKGYGHSDDDDISMRVIADHSRAMAFLISDGVLPSNEGRGYVLRRIMRRAARHAKMLGFREPILYQTADRVVAMMGQAYPELQQRRDFLAKVIHNEELRFVATLENGLRILNDAVARLKAEGRTELPGELIFKLYDTYGFPVDLTADIVEKEGFTLDEAGFEEHMEQQRQQARASWGGSGEEAVAPLYRQLYDEGLRSEFTGYNRLQDLAEIKALVKDGQLVSQVQEGDKAEIVTAISPFYGESGGQVGDIGTIATANGRFQVEDTQRPVPNLIVHRGHMLQGSLATGDAADLVVEDDARAHTARNHTATHILHAVLQEMLGDHIKQAGSLVTPERLRFDFTHFAALSNDELVRIEAEVNRRIRRNDAVDQAEMSLEEAQSQGATALFGEKYGEQVRVIRLGDYSLELCGGTHAEAAGDIGLFKILQESGISAGVRRIEAVTGLQAWQYIRQQEETLQELAHMLKTDTAQLPQRLSRMVERQRTLERELETLQDKLHAEQAADLLAQVQEIDGIRLLATEVEADSGKALRDMSDPMRNKLGSGVLVLGSRQGDKAQLLVAVSKDLTDKLHAGNLVRELAAQVGGKGGGRPDLAQAGGNAPQALPTALEQASELLKQQLTAANQ